MKTIHKLKINHNQRMDKKIKTLRTFFRVSNAAFDFQNSIQLAFNGIVTPNKMHQLHKQALVEIEKEAPDLLLIDNLLAEMESTAEQMKPKTNFPKGDVISCSCYNGIIVCPGCDGEQSKFGICAGCHGKGKVVCGKCGGKNKI